MRKEFISYQDLRTQGWEIASIIFQDDFIPTSIIGVLRGGIELSNSISEYFKFMAPEANIHLGAVAASSYIEPQKQGHVKIHGWTFAPQEISPEDKVLIIDDIWDTGNTLETIINDGLLQGVNKDNLRIAVYASKNYKFDSYEKRVTGNQKIVYTNYDSFPNYWSQNIDPDIWINFPHELVGLEMKDIKTIFGKEVVRLFEKEHDKYGIYPKRRRGDVLH